MCYSAMAEQDLKATARRLGARVDMASFEALFRARLSDTSIKIPKAMEANFADPESPIEHSIHALIDQHRAYPCR